MRRISPHPAQSQPPVQRRGVATVWIIAAVPAILTLLIMLTDVGTLWQARMELETALESAALAAVKEWKATGNTNLARQAAQNFAATNTVLGKTITLTSNSGGGGPNDNSQCTGDIVLGSISAGGAFQSSVTPASTAFYGARVQTKHKVQSLWKTFAGVSFGPYTIQADTVAQLQFDPGGTPRLMRPTSFSCP